jgi:hypothetical protein
MWVITIFSCSPNERSWELEELEQKEAIAFNKKEAIAF